MTTAIGPQSRNYTTTRPPTTGVASAGADTWVKDCSSPSTPDGTFLNASFYNVLIAQVREAIRGGAITLDDTNDTMLLQAIKALAAEYDIGGFVNGAPASSLVALSYVAVRAFTLPANFAGAQGKAQVAATALTTFVVNKNGAQVGTMQFALGAATATFATTGGTAVSFAAGDILTVVAPLSPDATLASVAFRFKGSQY